MVGSVGVFMSNGRNLDISNVEYQVLSTSRPTVEGIIFWWVYKYTNIFGGFYVPLFMFIEIVLF